MNFACDRCGKRFTSEEEAVPGRTYRIPCDCGNTIVLEVRDPAQVGAPGARPAYTTPPGMYRLTRGAPDPFAPVPEPRPGPLPDAEPRAPQAGPEPLLDDPFAQALSQEKGGEAGSAPWAEVTPTFAGPYARRDPDAPSEESAEYRITGSGSYTFDDVLRRVRRQGFAAGAAAGALAGAVVAGVLAVLSAGPATTPTATATATPAAVVGASPGAAPIPIAAPARSATPGPSAAASPTPTAPSPPTAASTSTATAAPRAEAPPPAPERPAPAPRAAAREAAVLATPGPTARETSAPGAPGAPADTDPLAFDRREAASPPPAAPAPRADPRPEPAAPAEPPRASAAAGEPADPAPASAAEPGVPAPSSPASTPGAVDEHDVAEAVRARRAALDACVAAAPADPAATAGHRFFLKVVVEPSGRVSEAQIDDPDVEATPLGTCLTRLVRELTFAAFEGDPVRVELALQYGTSQ